MRLGKIPGWRVGLDVVTGDVQGRQAHDVVVGAHGTHVRANAMARAGKRPRSRRALLDVYPFRDRDVGGDLEEQGEVVHPHVDVEGLLAIVGYKDGVFLHRLLVPSASERALLVPFGELAGKNVVLADGLETQLGELPLPTLVAEEFPALLDANVGIGPYHGQKGPNVRHGPTLGDRHVQERLEPRHLDANGSAILLDACEVDVNLGFLSLRHFGNVRTVDAPCPHGLVGADRDVQQVKVDGKRWRASMLGVALALVDHRFLRCCECVCVLVRG